MIVRVGDVLEIRLFPVELEHRVPAKGLPGSETWAGAKVL